MKKSNKLYFLIFYVLLSACATQNVLTKSSSSITPPSHNKHSRQVPTPPPPPINKNILETLESSTTLSKCVGNLSTYIEVKPVYYNKNTNESGSNLYIYLLFGRYSDKKVNYSAINAFLKIGNPVEYKNFVDNVVPIFIPSLYVNLNNKNAIGCTEKSIKHFVDHVYDYKMSSKILRWLNLNYDKGSYVIVSKEPIPKKYPFHINKENYNIIDISNTGEQSYGVILEIIRKTEDGNILKNIDVNIGSYIILNYVSKVGAFIAVLSDGFKAYAEKNYTYIGYCSP